MLPEFDRPIRIDLTVKSSQTELLKGLDVWLKLGLISETTIEAIAENHLSFLIPEPKSKQLAQNSIISLQQLVSTPEAEATFVNQNSQSEEVVERFRYQDSPPEEREEIFKSDRPLFIFQIWQSFKDEFSIRWLLFLGVFLVMVSSGVLAATQWEDSLLWGNIWFYGVILWFSGGWLFGRLNKTL